MAFPDPSIPPPPLGLYQFSYRGVAFGGINPTTPYQLKGGITGGMDLPAIQAGDVQRPNDDGEFIGMDVSNGRDITADLIITTDTITLDHARQTLGAVFTPTGNTEYPLFLQLPSGSFACMARPRKFAFAADLNTIQAAGTPAIGLLHATDPRWYASPSRQAVVGLPQGGGTGLTIPATVPWVLSSGTIAQISAWNLGTREMRPVIIFTGPCTNPSAANLSIQGNPTVTFNVALNAGDTLTVDLDWQTILLQTAGSTTPAYRPDLEASGSTWWDLQPANGPAGIGTANLIEFTTGDSSWVAGTMTLQYADAYPVL